MSAALKPRQQAPPPARSTVWLAWGLWPLVLAVNVTRTWPSPSARATGDGHRPARPARLGDPDGEKRSVTELEADEVGASLKWATAKVERSSQRGNGERNAGRQR